MRRLIWSYTKYQGHLPINKVQLRDGYSSEYASLEEYRQLYLLTEGQEAKGIVLAIAPIILRLNVDVVCLDDTYPEAVRSILIDTG